MDMVGKLRWIMDRTGWKQHQVAEQLGVTQPTVNRWLSGADPRGATRDRINELFEELSSDRKRDSTPETPPASMAHRVRLIGKAGAGPSGEVVFDMDEQTLGFVDRQVNATDATVALLVEGESMRGIANDGWIVYYDDLHEAPEADLYGELCVVRLESGATLVKFLQPGRGPGLYDLESTNAATLRDVAVRWATPVTSIVPRKAARKLMKRDPTVGVQTVKVR